MWYKIACVMLLVGPVGLTVSGSIMQGQQAQQGQPQQQSPQQQAAAFLDLRQAVIVGPASPTLQEQTAFRVLVEEIEKRTLIKLPLSTKVKGGIGSRPVIAVGTFENLKERSGDIPGGSPSVAVPGPEGYVIQTSIRSNQPVVTVVSVDARGMLFGVGRLLRELRMGKGAMGNAVTYEPRLEIASGLKIATVPKVKLRGHQLGYRPKTNSYDGWDVPQWEQYIRDLAIFGTNAIELVPPVSDDTSDSPHFPRPQIDMLVEMSRIADSYGLDVWLWYPALEKDYVSPANVDKAVQDWAAVLKRLPRVDAVFVPGGDPGHTKPDVLLAMLEKQAASLKKIHPKAAMWVSPQNLDKVWLGEFYGLLRKEPAWLTGVVFGPWNRDSFADLRRKVPARYRIRRYPDITHSLGAQYPVNDWDVAHALTSSREPINPRPVDHAVIFRKSMKYGSDFITYSEGNNDDVNKFIWSGLGWDPDTPVIDILRSYSRYFIGDRYTESFAQGLLALERNWRGPLASNVGVYVTLQQFQDMERAATPHELKNWRFQQGLYRAYFDAYQRARLIAETAQESAAMERLRAAASMATAGAGAMGTLQAMDEAEQILRNGDVEKEKVAGDWRMRMYLLAEALYQSIHMQLDLVRYRAIGIERGATLASVETPLNNRRWLLAQFERIRALPSEEARLKELQAIINWTDPGPGGFYDDLGNPQLQPHLVRGAPFEEDPGPNSAVATGFGYNPEWRLSWMTNAESFYDVPLTLKYPELDVSARYKLRVVYAISQMSHVKVRIVANGKTEIAPFMPKPFPVAPVEFDIPMSATAGGSLTIEFIQEPGRARVAEVWLIRQESAQ